MQTDLRSHARQKPHCNCECNKKVIFGARHVWRVRVSHSPEVPFHVLARSLLVNKANTVRLCTQQ